MTSNQPEENSTNEYKLINNPENKKSTFNDEGEVSVSISKYEGNIFGSPKTINKKKKKPILLDKSVGRGDSSKKSKKNLKLDITKKQNENKKKVKTEDLNLKLDNLNSELIKEQDSLIEEVQKYNTTISQKQTEINSLSKENTVFMSRLNDIKNEMDSYIKLSKIFNLKFQKLEKQEKSIKATIQCREEELNIEIKNTNIEKKEKEKLEFLLQENKENRENLLKEEYISLEQKIKVLKREIQDLKFIINEHEYCKKNINVLKNSKNLLENEYEFEKKKLNMFNINLTEDNYQKEKILKIKLIKDKNKNNMKIKDINDNKTNKKKEKLEINNSAKNFIFKQIELANKIYIKNAGDNYYKINESSSNQKPKNLFLNEEMNVLKQIIPEKNLNKFNERYNLIEHEKKLIEEKIKENKNIKNKLHNNINLIDYSAMKIKEQKMIKTELKSNFIKFKKTTENINNKIKELKKQIKTYDDLLKYKNRENYNYKRHLEYMQQRIDNGQLVLRKDINEENKIDNNENENNNENDNDNYNADEENNDNNDDNNENEEEENEEEENEDN